MLKKLGFKRHVLSNSFHSSKPICFQIQLFLKMKCLKSVTYYKKCLLLQRALKRKTCKLICYRFYLGPKTERFAYFGKSKCSRGIFWQIPSSWEKKIMGWLCLCVVCVCHTICMQTQLLKIVSASSSLCSSKWPQYFSWANLHDTLSMQKKKILFKNFEKKGWKNVKRKKETTHD